MFRLPIATVVLLAVSLPATAQDAGYWKATSKTAMSITGDIAISAEKLTINFNTFTIAELRTLKPEEINATFNAEASEPGGHLYRLNIPAKRPFEIKFLRTPFFASWHSL